MFEHIIGNEKAKDCLAKMASKGTVGNSLLFAGPDGIGKSLFAEAFAKLLICQDDPQGIHRHKVDACNHPDIRIYRPEGKVGMHSIAAMRQFSEDVYLAPCEAKWKLFIIHEADRMLPYSANALLKTFEEPAEDAVIILLSNTPAALLPTILSRCRTVFFHPLSENEVSSYLMQRCNKTTEDASSIAAMAQGSIGRALRLANEGSSPVRGLLLDLFANGRVENYKQLSETAEKIAEGLEAERKKNEVEVRNALLHGSGEDLSAVQKQNIEKEIEGVLTMQMKQEAYALFEAILGWYRDLHLIHVNGNPSYLIHRDYQEACKRIYERGGLLSLELVQKAISEAQLALERSTSLNICFENLFLKLILIQK